MRNTPQDCPECGEPINVNWQTNGKCVGWAGWFWRCFWCGESEEVEPYNPLEEGAD